MNSPNLMNKKSNNLIFLKSNFEPILLNNYYDNSFNKESKFIESENFLIINNQFFNKNFSENDISNIEIEIDDCKVEKNIQIEYYNNLDFYISNKEMKKFYIKE